MLHGSIAAYLFSYLFEELAELPAFSISGAQALLWRHHCTDAAAIRVLGRAVDLPTLLRADCLEEEKRRSVFDVTEI